MICSGTSAPSKVWPIAPARMSWTFLQVAAEVPVKTEIELFPLDQANEALLRLKQSQINGAAVLQVSE